MPLVISRTPNETLVLTTASGERIEITARYVAEKENVRLVVEAPRTVLIIRGELEGAARP